MLSGGVEVTAVRSGSCGTFSHLLCCLRAEAEKHVDENSFVGNSTVIKWCICERRE